MTSFPAISDTPKLDPALVGALRTDLLAADWTVDRVGELVSSVASEALAREQRIPALMELAGLRQPAAVLTRLFILADEVEPELVAVALPTLGLTGALALGLMDESAAAKIDLRPHAAELTDGQVHNWWIASDQAESQTGRPLNPDHVLGIGSATLSLLKMTVREPVDRALDLGTGCGIQALYLATHAQEVVATDLSERACDFARFNAALNDVQMDVRQGSLFEPVRGELFGQITSNPPFVITPQRIRDRALMEYRDGGMDRDNLMAKVISEGPSYLRPGGLLQMLANWELRRGAKKWSDRAVGWIEAAQTSAQLQVWLVQRDVLDYGRYAEMWMRDSGGQLVGRDRWESDYREWISDFQSAQVDEIGMGFLAIRRLARSGPPKIEAQYLPEGTFPDGRAVLSALANLDLPEDWRERRLIRASDVREDRHYVPGQGDPELIRLTQGAGMGRARTVSQAIAALVGVADGELSISQVIHALAALTERPVEVLEAEVLAELPGLLQSMMVSFVDLS